MGMKKHLSTNIYGAQASQRQPMIFLSYAYTGEDESAVLARLRKVCDILTADGLRVYCVTFDDATKSYTAPGQYMHRGLAMIPWCQIVLVIQTSPRRSEGMLMEIGAALALGKRVVVAQHRSAIGKSYIADPTLVHDSRVWNSEEELVATVRALVE